MNKIIKRFYKLSNKLATDTTKSGLSFPTIIINPLMAYHNIRARNICLYSCVSHNHPLFMKKLHCVRVLPPCVHRANFPGGWNRSV